MKRKTSTTPTKIWSFGALAPTTNEKLLQEQLFLGHRYYNALIEIERRRREKFRSSRAEAAPELARLENEWQKLDAELTSGIDALPKVKGKKVLTPELLALRERARAVSIQMKSERKKFSDARAEASAPLKALKVELEKLDAELTARAAALPVVNGKKVPSPEVIALRKSKKDIKGRLHAERAALDPDSQGASDEVKQQRALTDLFWGSYLLIEKQIEQARKSKLDPCFRRFEGNGRVGVQLQGGLTLPELLSGQDTRLRLVARQSTPLVKKPKAQHEVHIRVGSEGRAPIWAVLPVVIHRDIPADARIQWAWIKVKNVGGVRKYFLQIAMESDTFDLRHAPRGIGTVAVNFGWRAHPDGRRRVAYAVDDAGNEEEFAIPAKIESSLAFVNSLQSARDLHFEDARRALGAFMATHEVPEWMKKETATIWLWKSPARLAKVAARLTEELLQGDDSATHWRTERLAAVPKLDLFAPATEIFTWLGGGKVSLKMLAVYLEIWRRKNRHLREWETSQRENTLAHRNELFRIWSRRLADRYSEIRVEEFDLREMAKTPEPTEEARPKGFRVTRSAAAPGEFRMRLKEVAGSKIVKAPAHGNTITCFECRHMNERSLLRLMTCVGCGKEFDQDSNNCRNQLRERNAGAPDTGGARNPEKPLANPVVSGKRKARDSKTDDVVAAE